jgi:potassium efflux system protein
MRRKLFYSRAVLLIVLVVLSAAQAFAQPTPTAVLDPQKAAEQQNARRQILQQEKAEIERSRQDLDALSKEMPRRLENLQVGQLTAAMVEQARLDVDSSRLHQEDLQAEIADAERRIKDLLQSIDALEAQEQLLKNPAKDAADSTERHERLQHAQQVLAQQRVELDLENQHLANLRSFLQLTALRLSLKEQWRARVEELYNVQQERNRREAQADLIERLQREKQAYLEQIANLRQRLEQEAKGLSVARRSYLETMLQNATEQVILIDLDVRLANLGNDLARLEGLAAKTDAKPEELQDGLGQLRGLQGDLQMAVSLLQRKLDLYQQQKQVVEQSQGLSGSDSRLHGEQAGVIGKLVGALKERLNRIQELLKRGEDSREQLELKYKASLSKDLLARQTLPGNVAEWRQFLQTLASVPEVLWYQVRLSLESANEAMLDASALRWLGLAAAELTLLWLIRVARYGLQEAISRAETRGDGGFTQHFLALILAPLVRRNLLGIGSASALLVALWILRVPQPGLGIIMILVLLWVGIKTPISLAWLLLASPQLPTEQQRPGLYRQWVGIVLSAGILAAMTLLVRLSALPEAVIDACDRLFMAQWLLAAWPVLRTRRLLIDLLVERFAGHYWFVSLRVISLCLPVALLGAALLGLIGYRNLAWAVAWYLVVLIAVALGLMMVRGLLHDLVVLLKNYAVTHSAYGLLWTQDVINPLHRILDILLYLAAWAVLFGLYGLELQSPFVAAAWHFLEQPLFTLAGAEITLWRIAVTLVTVWVVIWFARWCRGVTYRWVFSRLTDLGVRHSLSAFTQYFIVLTGLLIVLRLLGLDLTTLTVFAGAVGVGIGFGLKNVADNFISGLMLLIERPLRSGDIVKIGDNEGEITRIGVRSLTMKTWDNMEVIIPNSEVITHAFVNWTHQDKILRTVLIIGVGYDTDPHAVKAILERILKTNEAVLKDPEPLVLLWEFADSAVNFRVQYFIDVGKHSLVKTRAEVLFAIWDNFKQEGIDIPYPQRDLRIKEWPEAIAGRRSEESSPARVVAIGQAP